MIGFIALYQDWVPFLWNVVFTVLSHGIGSALRTDLIFNHPAGQTSPWRLVGHPRGRRAGRLLRRGHLLGDDRARAAQDAGR